MDLWKLRETKAKASHPPSPPPADEPVGGAEPPRVDAELARLCERFKPDLIVMGSHDPHFTDYLIGSNAAHVALHTPCSVLVVR